MGVVKMTFIGFYKEVSKSFFVFFMIGAVLILISGYWPFSLFWLLDLLISFSISFVLMFRRPEVRSEFRGDR